jgi:solute carrier family 32 (vesicular inhibitory amino acid transporter)
VRRFIVRTGLAISCLVTARFVPFLALLMALIGSFLTINVSLIFPVGGTLHACYLCWSAQRQGDQLLRVPA